MNIEKVKIQNYRLLKNFELDMKKELSLIVGKNNCGKTSFITIMDKFLNSNSNSTHFKWDDFNLEFQSIFYNKISENEEFYDGITMTLFINYSDEDSYLNIQKFMMDLNPENNIIVLEFCYFCPSDKFRILRRDLEKNNIDNPGKFSKFMKKNSNKYLKLKVHSKGYDCASERIIDTLSAEISISEIKKLIKCHVIKANRDASNHANDHSLSSLSAKYYELKKSSIEIGTIVDDNETGEELGIDVFNELNRIIIEADEHLNKVYNGKIDDAIEERNQPGIFSSIIENIKRFGGVSGETRVSIQSSIESKELLRDNTTLHYEHDGRYLPESYNGLGYLNLIGMIFEIETAIASFDGKKDEISADINLLFIEEPEAHTHPQLQYIFIKNIKKLIDEKKGESNLNIQTILTTHSAHIVADCDFNDIRYLKRESTNITAMNFELLKEKYGGDEATFKFIKQYLKLSNSELFFADKAIFIEGETERMLLPAIMKKIDDVDNMSLPLLSQNISIIEAGTYINKFREFTNFLGLKTLIITDIDGTKLDIVKDTNGNPVLKKNGEPKCAKYACPSSEATFTSNPVLKEFFDLKDNENDFETLAKKKCNDKLIDENSKIAYQTEENDYFARSFEDSFIALNFDFVKHHKDNFTQGLKNRAEFEKESESPKSPNYYDLADKCINKKSSFALEILYYDGIDEKTWKIPGYIKEGLEWLKKI